MNTQILNKGAAETGYYRAKKCVYCGIVCTDEVKHTLIGSGYCCMKCYSMYFYDFDKAEKEKHKIFFNQEERHKKRSAAANKKRVRGMGKKEGA